MRGRRHVILFWALRRGRLDPEPLGPCSATIDVPARRAKTGIERGRVRGFYLRYPMPPAVVSDIAEEYALQDRLYEEIHLSNKRVRRLEQETVEAARPPRQLTDQDGVRWRFGPDGRASC